MANLVMLIGGTGDQSAGVPYPTVMDKGLFDDPTVAVSDYVGTNGAAKLTLTSVVMGGPSGGQVYLTGNFSSLATLVAKTTGDIYAFVVAPVAAPEGYYKIISVDGTSGCYISDTNLDGETISSDDQATAVIVGGAGTNLAVAVARMADIDLSLGYNVDVLTNKNESLGATTISLSSDLKGRIRFIGTIYDASTANNNFADCSEEDDYPVIIRTGIFATGTSAYNLVFIHIKFTGNNYVSLTRNCIVYECVIDNTDSGNFERMALKLTTGAIAYGCVVRNLVGGLSDSINGVAYIDGLGTIDNCLIICNANMAVRIGALYQNCRARNNLIIDSDSGVQALNLNIANSPSCEITNNSVFGFKYALDVISLPVSVGKILAICNNVFWGKDAEDSVGLNFVSNSIGFIYSNNNYVGNYKTVSSYDIDSIVALTSSPFKNGSGNMNLASDFWLTDAAKLICKAKPTDFDLDGTDDNYQLAGAIMEQVIGGGSGGVSASRIFGGL